MSFHQPSVWLLLILLVLPILWWRRRSRRRGAVRFSSLEHAIAAGRTWAVRIRWIVPALRFAAIVLLIIAVARPQKGDEQTRINAEGIAIQLIVDRSGSMQAQDFKDERGRPTDRLSVVKKVVKDFVEGGNGLNGRPDDVIGAIAFASFADSLCPLTTDHAHLLDSIDKTTLALDRQESGTAIGDALALGVERLRSLEQRMSVEGGLMIKSKIIILLTDGENNTGDIEPAVAARMAAAYGIKVYTIGAGTKDGVAPVPGTDIFGRQLTMPVSIDEESLTDIARTTGAQYFRATDTDSLRGIYDQIDQLERTRINERRYVTYKEAAVESVTLGSMSLPPLLMVVLVLLLVETFLATTRFRALP